MTISAFARLEINYNVREKARADRKYQNDYLQRCAQKEKGGEKIKIKQTEKKKRSKQRSKIRNRTQIQREQPGRRARTGQTTFSTLQGACNFYRERCTPPMLRW